MYLSAEEENMLEGERGIAVQKSMEILVALGDIYNAEKLVNITSAQISGVSYKTIGDAGLKFLEDMGEDATVKVQSTLNPAGIDLKRRDLGFSDEFTKKQLKIIEAYRAMNITTSCSCTPYLIGNIPVKGDHVAWSESSAVTYVNSVIGAKTNREGGPGALSAAICGKTPEYGYHLDEERKASLIVEVETKIKGIDFGVVGYLVGKTVGDGVPFFKFENLPTTDNLKSLGAALASSGAVALYHVDKLTPEHNEALSGMKLSDVEKITIDKMQIVEAKENLSTASGKPDLICLGCPHSSIDEIQKIAEIVEGKHLKNELWVCTSMPIKSIADRMGYTDIIEASGGKLVCDTCMVVAPIEELGFHSIGVDSAKAANYVPSMCGFDVIFDDLENLIDLE